MNGATVIVRTATRLLTPVIIALSVYLLVRGHDAPGGGFIAALVAGAGVVLRYLAFGREDTQRLMRFGFPVLLGVGLLIAAGTGLAGYLMEGAFLGGTIWQWALPVFGEVKIASSLIFDVGVYLIVVGVVVTVVSFLGEDRT